MKKPTPAGMRRLKMTVGEAVRCAAMDAEASRPVGALLVWQGEDGRIHKRVLPLGITGEDRLMSALSRLPPGDTPAAGSRSV